MLNFTPMLNSTVSVGIVIICFAEYQHCSEKVKILRNLRVFYINFFLRKTKSRICERGASLILSSHSVPRASVSVLDIFLFVEISVLL